jgi:15-cis-phytoene synthase
MAWWRERLDDLSATGASPAEPRLSAVAAELLPLGVTGAELTQLEDAWLPLLDPFPWGERQARGLELRGRILFGIGAKLLGSTTGGAESAGALWSLVDAAQHCSDARSRTMLAQEARRLAGDAAQPMPRALRPLTVLAALAIVDLRDGSGTRRVAAALRHRLTGTLPRS